MTDYNLNTAQQSAAEHFTGPMMVLAGPGSGKTAVIVHRIACLIEKHRVEPRCILVVTFTKAAALEMKERFIKQFPKPGNKGVFISTFHSLFFMILNKRYGFDANSVLREDERAGIIKSIALKNDAPLDEDTIKTIITEIGLVKNDMLPIESFNSNAVAADLFREIYRAYESYKKHNGKIDFDDMMCKCYELFEKEPRILEIWRLRFKYILIDEFQDINKIQYQIVRMLAAPLNNLFIVGDDDQSIYSFRGARPDFLLNFKNEYRQAKEVVLDTNYRSTDSIINLCNKIIAANKIRYGKQMTGRGIAGKPPRLIKSENIEPEAAAIAERIMSLAKETDFSEMAVIYRVNIQSRAFTDAFINRNIPFTVKDEAPSIYEHWICLDIVAYLTLGLDIKNKDMAARIINKPSRYINAAYIRETLKTCKNQGFLHTLMKNRKLKEYQLSRISELCFYLNGIKTRKPYDAYRYIRQAVNYDEYIIDYCIYRKIKPTGLFEILDELTEGSKNFETIEEYIAHVELARETAKRKQPIRGEKQKGVVLSTMHSVKGLEFDVVFIASAVEGLIPHEKSVTPEEKEEERRLFYVGATRARKLLYVSIIENRYENKVAPTEFLPLLHDA